MCLPLFDEIVDDESIGFIAFNFISNIYAKVDSHYKFLLCKVCFEFKHCVSLSIVLA